MTSVTITIKGKLNKILMQNYIVKGTVLAVF